MKKNQLFILFIILTNCGIEVPQPIPRLYSPNGVQVQNAGNPPSTIRVTWFGVNPEEEFSGYNIYYTDEITIAESYNGTKILCPNFNPIQATLPIRPPFNIARKFSFDITKFYYANQGELFKEGKEYWFYVKAYNQLRNIESPPSRYSQVIFQDNID